MKTGRWRLEDAGRAMVPHSLPSQSDTFMDHLHLPLAVVQAQFNFLFFYRNSPPKPPLLPAFSDASVVIADAMAVSVKSEKQG